MPPESLKSGDPPKSKHWHALLLAAIAAFAEGAPAHGQQTPQTPRAASSHTDTIATPILQSALPPATLKEWMTTALQGLRANAIEAKMHVLSAQLPDGRVLAREAARSAFETLQNDRLKKLGEEVSLIYPTAQSDVDNLRKKANRQLQALWRALNDQEYGVFIDADTQTLHLFRRTGNTLTAVISTRATTGKDGVTPNPSEKSAATKSGLNRVTRITTGLNLSGQDVSTLGEHHHEQPRFTVLEPNGATRDIYVAPVSFANVGQIGFYFAGGQAIHEGPLPARASSNGCVRVTGTAIALFQGFLHVGTPIMVFGTTSASQPESPARTRPSNNSKKDWQDKAFTPR